MPTLLEQLEYGFDRDSRRTWRRRALTTGQDDAYGYDGLSQVVNAARGNLNLNATAIGGVPAEDASWDYDPTGNWRGYRVEADGAVTLEQRRVHDKGNRLMQVEGSAGAVLVDRAGRMTQVPPDAAGEWDQEQRLVWDAWSRLVSVANGVDGVIGRYHYDGLNRRMTRVVYGFTWHTYYSDAWRPLEERREDDTTAARQYYWGARHRDDLVRRDRATSGGALDETRYVLMDYFSPAAITDESGEVTERYAFSAFGVRSILAPDFSPRDTSECAWEFGFQGQFLDAESGFYDYGYRYYSPSLGRWLSKDPIEEDGGLNLYALVDNRIVNLVDFLGLAGLDLGPIGLPSADAKTLPETVDKNNWPPSLPNELKDKLKDNCKYYVIVGHGDKNTVWYYENGTGTPKELPAQSLAELIKQQKNYKEGTSILLLTCCSCSSSNKNYPTDVAAGLAAALKVDVAGATCTLAFIHDGTGKISSVKFNRGPLDPAGNDEWRVRPNPNAKPPANPTPPIAPKPSAPLPK